VHHWLTYVYSAPPAHQKTGHTAVAGAH